MRILGFRHGGLRRFYETGDARGIPAAYVEKVCAMLTAISEAEELAELDTVPGWRLHPLKGDRKGVWSLTISRNQRLAFKVAKGSVSETDIEDYH